MKTPAQISPTRAFSEMLTLFRSMGVEMRRLYASACLLVAANVANYFTVHLFILLVRCLATDGEASIVRTLARFHIVTDLDHVLASTLCLMVAGKVVSAAFTYLASTLVERENREIEQRVRTRVFAKLLHFGKAYFDKHSIPKLNRIILESSEKCAERLNAFHATLAAVLKLTVIFLVLFGISWMPAAVVFAAVSFTAIVSVRTQAAARKLANRLKRAGEGLDEKMLSLLGAHELVKFAGTAGRESRRFSRLASHGALLKSRVFRMERAAGLLGEGSFLAFTLLLVALIPLFRGQTAPTSDLLTFFLVMRPVESTVVKLGRSFNLLTRSSGVFESLQSLLHTQGKTYLVQGGTKEFQPLRDRLEVRGLNFSYAATGRPVLRNVSFGSPAGEWLAITGENGQGKSTLFHLLTRMYRVPKETIFLDGKAIEKFTLESLRQEISIVPQHPTFLDGTLWQALTYGCRTPVTLAAVEILMRGFGLAEWVRSLPDGYHSRIGTQGTHLSGGQSQRLALVRAFIRPASIVLLDEATSSLDAQGKHEVLDFLSTQRGRRTVWMITHDPEEARLADRTVVLTEGGAEVFAPSSAA